MEKTLREKIKEALENDQLAKQMSVIRMEAAKQNISDEELNQLVETEKQAFEALRKEAEMKAREEEIQKKAVAAAIKNRYILWGVCAVALILEWIFIFRAHPAEGESHRLVLTLIVNFITLLAVAIGAAVFFRKHN